MRAIGHDRIRMVKGVRNDHNFSLCVIGLAASRSQKAQNDHNLSLRAIRHDSIWMAKMCGMTIICVCMSSDLPPLDDKRCRMTIICLCMSSDSLVYGWQKGVQNDNNLSPHVIGLAASG